MMMYEHLENFANDNNISVIPMQNAWRDGVRDPEELFKISIYYYLQPLDEEQSRRKEMYRIKGYYIGLNIKDPMDTWPKHN